MENREDIFDALTAFGKNPNQQDIPLILEQYLDCVAKNGETLFPWTQLKPLIVGKMEKVIQELKQGLDSEAIPSRPNVENVRFDVIHARIIDALHRFNGAPFTIQRLCELLTEPKRHYKRSDKFMRGLEKNVLVVSTVDPFGRKVVCESSNKHMVNGMDMNGAFPPRDSALTVPLPPVPGWVFTTTAATTSRTQTPPSESVADQRLGSQNSTQTPGMMSNGIMSSSLAPSVYTDQGEQLAVQSEEVIEETVVTMETNEVSSVTTDAGESMAEAEEDEDMADERTSSSSSSSSSSEELSTSSDSIDSSIPGSISKATPSSSTEPVLAEHRPWASISHEEGESQAESIESPSSCQTETQDNCDNTTTDTTASSSLISSSSCSHGNTEPTSFTSQSISPSAGPEHSEDDTLHPMPESSQFDEPQTKEVIHTDDAAFSSHENPSFPNDSISASVPDSNQSSEASQSDSVSGESPPLSTPPNVESMPMTSSSDSNSESSADNVSLNDHVVEKEPQLALEELAVSSSSSSNTSPLAIPVSDDNKSVSDSIEKTPDSRELVVSSEDDADTAEPPSKCLKLDVDDGAVSSFNTVTEASAPAIEGVNNADSSDDILTSALPENITESHLEDKVDEGDGKSEQEPDNSYENQTSDSSINSTKDAPKQSADEPNDSGVKSENEVASSDQDLPSNETCEEEMNVG